jgi:hypothetical protein
MGVIKQPRPTATLGMDHQMTLIFDDASLPRWARNGLKVERAIVNGNNEILFTLIADSEGPKAVAYGAGDWRVQLSDTEKLPLVPQFGITTSRAEVIGPHRLLVTVPAERNLFVPRPKRNRAKRAPEPKPTALATVKETIKTMAKESPPPDFTPAIPLREAVDTINSYVLAEGEALRLTISKRGRLKVEYAYGG